MESDTTKFKNLNSSNDLSNEDYIKLLIDVVTDLIKRVEQIENTTLRSE